MKSDPFQGDRRAEDDLIKQRTQTQNDKCCIFSLICGN